MNKQQAIEILQNHYDFKMGLSGKPTRDISKEEDPDKVQVYLHNDYKEVYDDFCKTEGTIQYCFDEEGGEDEGSYYHYVHKIEHPTLGVAHLYYQGRYDSWNGIDWSYNDNPKLVQPQKRMVEVTDWIDV